jgi:hypothetical protein
MSRIILTTSFLLVTLFSSGQKIYRFDCILKYRFTVIRNNIDEEQIYFFNKEDNSYFAVKIPEKNGKFILIITDYNGYYGKSILEAKQFDSLGVHFPSTDFLPMLNTFKDHINYEFKFSGDTIMEGINCRKIILSRDDGKSHKRKKSGYFVYFVDTNAPVLPLLTIGNDYEIWKARHHFPNGIIRKKVVIDRNGKIYSEETLIERLDKNFEIKIL